MGDGNLETFRYVFKSAKEKSLIQKRRNLYSRLLYAEGDIYFDVGANFGNRIEPLIDMDLKIIAVEPQVKCVRYLRKRYGNRIVVIPKGLGAKEEIRKIYLSDAHQLSSFSDDWIKATRESGRFRKYKWKEEGEVEITTLDNLIGIYGKPRFIKIDVEGFEHEVLKGLSHDIEFISFEYTVPERTESVLECIGRIVEISNQHQKQVEFNYSVGESMEWALDEWLTPRDMEREVKSERFLSSDFGDVYSRMFV